MVGNMVYFHLSQSSAGRFVFPAQIAVNLERPDDCDKRQEARLAAIWVGDTMRPLKLSRFFPVCGIYKITNKANKRIYIGKSKNIWGRWVQHVEDLVNGKHSNRAMLMDFQEMGIDVFEVKLLETCDENALGELEKEYIQRYYKNGGELYNSEYELWERMAALETDIRGWLKVHKG